ncbi:interferon-induced transmembrane protein 1-like [Echinops telfairi]|uniref:Interferon-induced transmembrane protein 1-like n=1 Tax=Echinops telfairi TaxID=9371 RepID=A0AC55DJS1_ECHTE|nr:interferon-induced transmembrane protein 1-like [Echinops telfairi]
MVLHTNNSGDGSRGAQAGGLRAPYHAAPMQSTMISIQSEPHVPGHIVWSLFSTLFLHCCRLGFVAYAYSVKSRDRKVVGDMIGAQSHASSAKYLNIFSTVLGLLGILIFVILLATGTVMSSQALPQMTGQQGH